MAIVRIGVVLDAAAALKQMLTPFKLFVGGPVGSGQQYMSWIHHDDLVGILLTALDQAQTTGPINGTAPHPVTNKEFSRRGTCAASAKLYADAAFDAARHAGSGRGRGDNGAAGVAAPSPRTRVCLQVPWRR